MLRYIYKKIHGRSYPEHILVWEKAHGQSVPPGYDIHHIDGNGRNNDPSNLMLLSHSDHIRLHHELRRKDQDPVDATDPGVIESRERQKRYYLNHKSEISERHRQYREATHEEQTRRHKKYREENREKIRSWELDNADRLREYRREYRKKNREKIQTYVKRRQQECRESIAEYQLEYRSRNAELMNTQSKLKRLIREGASQDEINVVRDKLAGLVSIRDAARESSRVIDVMPSYDHALEITK